ncbi:IMP dehydrogenase [Methanococcus voltae]|uniref:CBS domain-containing ParB/RepB/Spo0J family partition protein n=1 Tax=Methanococcus voltae TaxID=2188 RepID=UPI001AE9C90D|nr:CBS domain-containing protein [Methanococcus voltae]MBP2143315.1 IMP dehydrogenase [Methanococcus voltae]
MSVKEYMTKKVNTLPLNATVCDAIKLVEDTTHDTFPIVESGKIIGIVSVHDLIGKEKDEKIKNIMTDIRDMVVTYPDADVLNIGRVMFRTGFSKLPVVDKKNNLLGILTNTDVLRSQIEKTTPKKLEKIVKTYRTLGYDLEVYKDIVPVEELKPTQNKVYEDELYGRIYELERGLAEPLIVIKTNLTKYIIVDGHHRAVAANKLKVDTLDAYVLDIKTARKLGIEKTAEKQGLNSLCDIQVLDPSNDINNDICSLKIYE